MRVNEYLCGEFPPCIKKINQPPHQRARLLRNILGARTQHNHLGLALHRNATRVADAIRVDGTFARRFAIGKRPPLGAVRDDDALRNGATPPTREYTLDVVCARELVVREWTFVQCANK